MHEFFDLKNLNSIEDIGFDGRYAMECHNCGNIYEICLANGNIVFRCGNDHGICVKCVEKIMHDNIYFPGFMEKKFGDGFGEVECWDGENEIPTQFCKACREQKIMESEYKDIVNDICKDHNIDFEKEKQKFLSRHHKNRSKVDTSYDNYCTKRKKKEKKEKEKKEKEKMIQKVERY